MNRGWLGNRCHTVPGTRNNECKGLEVDTRKGCCVQEKAGERMESVRLEGWQGLGHEGFVGCSVEFDFTLMVDTAGHPHLLLRSRVLPPHHSLPSPTARSAGC